MTLTIELDDDTTKLLEQKATEAHMDFSDYVASVLSRTADSSMAAARHRNLGYGEVQGHWISENFDEPLEAFKDYL
jgi:hypothetical protein